MITLESGSFAYDDGPTLLPDVTLAVGPGEYVIVAGASGSGKTTLARLLAGQTGGDAGSSFRGAITLDGETVRFDGASTDPRIDAAAWSARVAYVAQGGWGQLSMMSATVGEEIAFGPANRGVPAGELRRLVTEVAAALRLTDLLHRDPRRLSGGQLQRTVIASAVVQRPRVLVLDEPFQGLDDDAAQDVAAALAGLRRDGTGVVVCEPMLPRTAPQGARVLALAEGRRVFDGPLVEARRAGLPRYGIGTAGDPPRPEQGAGPAPVDPSAPELVAVARVSFRHAHDGGGPAGDAPDGHAPDGGRAGGAGLSGVDLSVRAGEIVAVRGPNGSGKSTLLQHLNGLHRADAGAVTVGGLPILRQPTGTLAATVGYLFQDTDQQLFERTVLREVAYGPRAAGLAKDDAARRAVEVLEAMGLGSLARSHPYELGFVQRRLVAVACLLATGPPVWVLDEPTAGLDGPTRSMLAGLLVQRAGEGGAVVLATHDASFADAVAHRTVWLEAGRVRTGDAAPGA
ncbi:ABC transporter ATP-binding protein [Arthrobacter sp. B0490]|uniref:ABC transporter ATP-binding protein n=1 Tax=Arthrobacter sp. B0490 TaxID=2058891 RepID=UPI000CE4EDF5|nr:ABC transporter ATP-binding protein [Arthrobacter sp. B0490]